MIIRTKSQATEFILKKLGAGSRGRMFASSPNLFSTNDSRHDGDRDAQTVPNDLARQDASEDMHINLLGSWLDLELS